MTFCFIYLAPRNKEAEAELCKLYKLANNYLPYKIICANFSKFFSTPHSQNLEKLGLGSIFQLTWFSCCCPPPCHCHLPSFPRSPPTPLSFFVIFWLTPPPPTPNLEDVINE